MTFPLSSSFFATFFMVNHQMFASEMLHNNHSSSSRFKNVAWPHIRAGGGKTPTMFEVKSLNASFMFEALNQ